MERRRVDDHPDHFGTHDRYDDHDRRDDARYDDRDRFRDDRYNGARYDGDRYDGDRYDGGRHDGGHDDGRYVPYDGPRDRPGAGASRDRHGAGGQGHRGGARNSPEGPPTAGRGIANADAGWERSPGPPTSPGARPASRPGPRSGPPSGGGSPSGGWPRSPGSWPGGTGATGPARPTGGQRRAAVDYSDEPTPPPRSNRPGPPGATTGPGGYPGTSRFHGAGAFPGTGHPGSSARPPATPPPYDEGPSWAVWVAVFVGIAVLSGAAGYALNRVATDPPTATAPITTVAPTAGVPDTGSSPGTSAPPAGGQGTATAPTAEQVAIMLANNGLPLRTTVVYTARNDPDGLLGRPGGYTSRIAFSDTRVSTSEIAGARADAIERGGAIEVFADPAPARTRATALGRPTAGGDPPMEYTFLQGRVVLRLSLILTETMAAGYRTALAGLSSG